MLAGTNLSRCLARSGVDWVLVDTEHGNLADADMHEAVTTIAATGVSPIVRIAANEGWMVKRALDSGAHGIMVPLLQTADEARKLVKSAKFPPLGARGFGSPFSPSAFATGSSAVPSSVEYLQQANDALLTIVQIETKEALENVDEIAAVEGIDVLFVGPFDLGNNIGFPILTSDMHEELKIAIAKIREAAEKAGKASGIYCTSGAQAQGFADVGFRMISVSGDVIAIQTHMAEQVAAAKGGVAHMAYRGVANVASRVTGPYGK